MPLNKIIYVLLQGILLAFIWSSLVACGKNETILVTKEKIPTNVEVPIEETNKKTEEPETTEEIKEAEKISQENEPLCYVHISGAVYHPGVISIKKGSRVFEAIELAGGFLETADEDYVNQALEIADGIQIYVPTVDEVEQGTVAKNQQDTMPLPKGKEESSGKICLNTATIEELCTISGIGESRAKAILQYREEKGAFSTIEEIKNITGIKDGLFDKIKDKITVR